MTRKSKKRNERTKHKESSDVGQQQTTTKGGGEAKKKRGEEGELHNTARHKLNFFFASAETCREQNERVRERVDGKRLTARVTPSFPHALSLLLSLSLSQCLPSLSRLALEARFIICCNWSLNRRPPTCLTAQGKIVEMCVENLADVLLVFGKVFIIRITRSSDCQQLKRQGKQNM